MNKKELITYNEISNLRSRIWQKMKAVERIEIAPLPLLPESDVFYLGVLRDEIRLLEKQVVDLTKKLGEDSWHF